MSMRSITRPFRRGWQFVASISRQLLIGLGLVFLLGTLGLAEWVADKEMAIAVAIGGTFLGTLLITLNLPRLIRTELRPVVEQELATSQSERRLKQSERERQETENKWLEAAREIARLEAMRINVEMFRPVLKLGLLEVETNVTDFQHRIVTREERQGWLRNGYRDAYAGVVQIPVKAHLGVDLQKVRVHDSGQQLIVTGFVMTTVTDTAEGAKWLLDEVRTEYMKGSQVVKFKGDTHDQRSKAFSREHELQVRARLKEGLDFQVFESGLVRTAQQVLRVLLAPLGKEVRFETTPPGEGRELLTYLAEYNAEIARRVADLKTEMNEADILKEIPSTPQPS